MTRSMPAPHVSTTGAAPAARPSTPPAREPAAKPAKTHGFLSFRLPSQTVRFDKRQRWRLVASLSRVGFDGSSTLHDFSGVTSTLSGTIAVDLSRPDQKPLATIDVQAATLKTGIDERDAEMRRALDSAKYPQINFHLDGFTKQTLDAKRERITGSATTCGSSSPSTWASAPWRRPSLERDSGCGMSMHSS